MFAAIVLRPPKALMVAMQPAMSENTRSEMEWEALGSWQELE